MKRKEGELNISESRVRDRHLAYVDEFKHLLHEKKGNLKTVLSLIQELEQSFEGEIDYDSEEFAEFVLRNGLWYKKLPGESAQPAAHRTFRPGKSISSQDGEITITSWGHYRQGSYLTGSYTLVRDVDYYQLKIDGKQFFLKKVKRHSTEGFGEATSATKAKELLKDLDWVRVVESQLGYTDKTKSYYVAKWESFEGMVNLHGYILERGLLKEKLKQAGFDYDTTSIPSSNPQVMSIFEDYKNTQERLLSKLEIIRQRLQGWWDLNAFNTMYNPKTDEFVLFDLSENRILYNTTI